MTNWNNKEEVLKELEYEGYYLEYASEELKSDREFILSAVKKMALPLNMPVRN